jgi:hypothetical protein
MFRFFLNFLNPQLRRFAAAKTSRSIARQPIPAATETVTQTRNQ